MIQIQDLRIGNWLKLGNNSTQVLTITYDRSLGHCVNQPDLPVSEFEPIPLSGELLEQCGFEFYLAQRRECFRKDTFYLHKTQRKGYRYGVNTHIKYLHQLQNLYWCLVGKELEIKLH
jgi:hypothetical protein